LECAGSQKERKTISNLENDRFGVNRKMRQNMERSLEVGGQQDRMEILKKSYVSEGNR
jgi:hypothetical protein